MSRKPGYDKIKLETILYALRTSPHGSWVRDIAKKTGLKKSTVSHYINKHLKDKVEVVHDSKHIKLIKLKEHVPKHAEKKAEKRKPKSTEEVLEMFEEATEKEEPREVPDYIS